ncbi:GtrA family protein [Neorhizobium alkalisoli]|uniref:Putative flippase GtrA n=1 Tax=Neorhizobium alkalisoli TaxID=528178 RepID=A0A561QRN0_9HYPH|nr:GtrA family protein [Neorhizobium alkalisoli]TWF52987.1 putative flippase GtrA [Neorhizobium alkalisoli]
MKRLFWFLIAGGGGFLIDAGITHLLVTIFYASPFAARIPAIVMAMGFTWLINRSRTFGPSRHSLAVEGFRYWAVGITSALLNYAVYSALIYQLPMLQPVAAIVFASAAAMAYSFFGYSRFVFRR